ncbi:MAG: metallophosphoesterase family protein [Candidatus Paceibacterota bacterium]|jgi:hypothetical protein
MKLAIISDIHDNLANLEKFLFTFAESSGETKDVGIICCGDVTTPETLNWLTERFKGPIKLACGNTEIRREEFPEIAGSHNNLEIFAEVGDWAIEGLKIAFLHRPNKVEKLAKTGQYRFIFYGHTHKPWISQLGETFMANPGTLGGVFTAPTFAMLDTKTGRLELKKLY